MSQEEKSALAKAGERYGSYVVGFGSAIVTLMAAYFMPAERSTLIHGATTITLLTIFVSGGKNFVCRLLGMLTAGACTLAVYFMPDQANQLLSIAGMIAVLTLIVF